MDSILCPRCGDTLETVDHALVGCREVKKIWYLTGKWWRRNLEGAESLQELLQEDQTSGEDKRKRSLWEAMVWSFLYLIWSHRNKVVFEEEKSKLEELFFQFQRKVFEWIKRRDKKTSMEWANWLSIKF